MRISDWSSDVCSSDLLRRTSRHDRHQKRPRRIAMKPALFLTPLLGLAACTPAAPDPRGVDRDETVLTVTGTGRAEATPDQALFTAGLSSIAADAQAASARTAETMNKNTAALARLDIPARDIHTRNLSVNRNYYGANKGRYEASNSVAVRVRDNKRVSEALAAVTAAGANIVSGPNLSVADPEKANLGAYGTAYKAARAKAEIGRASRKARVCQYGLNAVVAGS